MNDSFRDGLRTQSAVGFEGVFDPLLVRLKALLRRRPLLSALSYIQFIRLFAVAYCSCYCFVCRRGGSSRSNRAEAIDRYGAVSNGLY